MRYIRTKDGIYEINWFDADNFGDEKGDIHSNYEIINEADTIEDLCDEFVLDHPLFGDSCKCLYHSFEKAKNGIKKRSDNAHNLYDFNIYGAIWTEWGLKYVAKMNEKGVLELL